MSSASCDNEKWPGGHAAQARWLDCALLTVLVFVVWAPFWTGDAVLFMGDTFNYFYPFRATLQAAFREGVMPYWEAATLSGNPFCANPQANCFYPLSLWYLLEDFFTAYHLALISHLVLAAAGAYLWCGARGHSRAACLVVALCLVGGGATLSMVNRLDKLQSLCWWPWVLLGLEWTRRGHRVGFASLSASLALQFLAGGLEVWAGAVATLPVWAMLPPEGSGAENSSLGSTLDAELIGDGKQHVVSRLRLLIYAGVAVCAGLLLAAPQWIPFRELLAHSTRSAGLSFERAVAMSMSPPDLWGILNPDLFFDSSRLSFHPWPGAPSEPRYFYGLYCGWFPIVAALTAVPLAFRRSDAGRTVRACLLIVVVTTLLALGPNTPVYKFLYDAFEPFRSFRYPEKFLTIAAFFALPLVAFGVDRWRARGAATLLCVGGGLLLLATSVVMPVALIDGWAWLLKVTTGGGGTAWAGYLEALLPGTRRQAALLVIAAGCATWMSTVPGRRSLARAGLVVVVWLDIWFGTAGINPVMARTVLESEPPLATAIKQTFGGRPARVHVLPVYEEGPLRFPDGLDAVRSYVWLWRMLYPNTGVMHGVHYADGARALRLDDATRFLAPAKGATLETQLDLAEIAGIDVLVSRREARIEAQLEASSTTSGLPRLRKLAEDVPARLALWQLVDTLPRAYLVRQERYYVDSEAVRRSIFRGELDPRVSVGLVGSGEGVYPAGGGEARAEEGGDLESAEAVEIAVLEGGRRRVVEEVEAGAGGVLVVAESWYPGWRAEVDGRPVPVLMANGYQQAVRLPPGRHHVVFAYRPRGMTMGWGLSALGAVFVVLSVVCGRLRSRPACPGLCDRARTHRTVPRDQLEH